MKLKIKKPEKTFSIKRSLMRKLIATYIFIVSSLTYIHSQEKYNKLPNTQNNCTIIIVNEEIISNENFIVKNEESIKDIRVMKEKPSKAHRFYNLSENGTVLVEMNKIIKSISQKRLNKIFGLDKNSKIYVNGYFVESPNYKIATKSIVSIELVEPDLVNNLKSKIINVWMINENERFNGCKN